MEVTLGGDRLGSGNKQKQYLDNYHRSTHDLSRKFASSMACGVLYPFMVIPATRGDHFSIDLNAAARTIPTQGPLFGSYKMQTDVFQVPMRLYQAFLHNNPLALGLNMPQVKLPKIKVQGKPVNNLGNVPFSNSCLLKYLGMSGIGRLSSNGVGYRYINAIPALGYYDIFKNYYSHKQEDYAYVLNSKKVVERPAWQVYAAELTVGEDTGNYYQGMAVPVETNSNNLITLDGNFADNDLNKHIKIKATYGVDFGGDTTQVTRELWWNEAEDEGFVANTGGSANTLEITLIKPDFIQEGQPLLIQLYWTEQSEKTNNELALTPFKLSNIDDMRMNLLSFHTLGESYVIDENSALPYKTLASIKENNHTSNEDALNGLVVKTYQSDMFNSWINIDWIDGENGISEITKIAVSDGGVYIDSMILARKLYDMMNRIAVGGGTYDDYLDVVYEESPTKHIESPLYLGGMSSEVVFEEIVQTSPANTTTGESTLGTLGGRGVVVKRKGGDVEVKVDEPSFIIGIVSITPRIYQTQGNEFYMTDWDSIDDLHKPALDGIGFQDLIGERLAYFDTKLNTSGTILSRSRIGKLPAWTEYMTAVDKAYGDFAELDGKGFMILNRNYEQDELTGNIKDATVYIDPEKYNYVFASTELAAQNFWVQIDCHITARRLMSAKQMPNL